MDNEEITMPEEETVPEEEAEKEPEKEPEKKSRRGRSGPRTEAQKLAAARTREEHRKMAESLRPEVYIQYQDVERSVESLVEEARAEFRKEKKRTQILSFKLYIKPEERAAYYVINDKSEGKISY